MHKFFDTKNPSVMSNVMNKKYTHSFKLNESGVQYWFLVKHYTDNGPVDIQPDILWENFNLEATIEHISPNRETTWIDIPVKQCKDFQWSREASNLGERTKAHLQRGEIMWCIDESKADFNKDHVADGKFLHITFGQCQTKNRFGVECKKTILPEEIIFVIFRVQNTIDLQNYTQPWVKNEHAIAYSFPAYNKSTVVISDRLNKTRLQTDKGKFISEYKEEISYTIFEYLKGGGGRSDTKSTSTQNYRMHGYVPDQDFLFTLSLWPGKEETIVRRDYYNFLDVLSFVGGL